MADANMKNIKGSDKIEKDEIALLIDEEFEALFGHKEEFDETTDVEFVEFDDYVALKKSGLLVSVGENVETVITKGFNIATPEFIRAEAEYFFGKSQAEIIKRILRLFSYEKIYILTGAIRKGIDIETILEVANTDKLFVEGLRDIVVLEEYLETYNIEQVPTQLLLQAKSYGLTDEGIAYLLNCTEHEVAHKIRSNSIFPKFSKFNCSSIGLPYNEEYYFSMYVDKKQFVDVSDIIDVDNVSDIVDAKDMADIIESDLVSGKSAVKSGVVLLKSDSRSGPPKVLVLCDDSKKIDKDFLKSISAKYSFVFVSNVTINKNEILTDDENKLDYKIYFEQMIFENIKNIFEFEKADKAIIMLDKKNSEYIIPRLKLTGIDLIENGE